MKKTLIIVGILSSLAVVSIGLVNLIDGGIGGGSQKLDVPDTIKTGESTDIESIVTATGGGGPIQGRFTDLKFHYRLVGEGSYNTLVAQAIDLPDNYKQVQERGFQSEAYKFTIPPYPKGTVGEVEYYTEMVFDGYPSKTEGYKKITVSDDAISSYDLNNNLSVFNVCGKDFKIDIITLEGIKVTERIGKIIDEEYLNSGVEETTICSSINTLPEYFELKSTIENYDSENLRYLVYLQLPFVIDLKLNLIYRVNEANNSLGEVLGSLR